MKDTSLVDLFQLQPSALIVSPKKEIETIKTDDKLEEDFEKSRDNIKNVLELSKTVLKESIELCRSLDNPRAFEATSSLITAITGASKDLLELHEKFNKLKNQEKQTEQNIGVQNNTQIVFKGTSMELLELIKKQ